MPRNVRKSLWLLLEKVLALFAFLVHFLTSWMSATTILEKKQKKTSSKVASKKSSSNESMGMPKIDMKNLTPEQQEMLRVAMKKAAQQEMIVKEKEYEVRTLREQVLF